MKVTLTLPPRDLSPNRRTHWGARSRAVKAHRGEAFLMTRKAMSGVGKGGHWWAEAGSDILIRATFFYRVKRRRDRDNAQASLKAALDGIADALGVDDCRFMMTAVELMVDADSPRVEILVKPYSK